MPSSGELPGGRLEALAPRPASATDGSNGAASSGSPPPGLTPLGSAPTAHFSPDEPRRHSLATLGTVACMTRALSLRAIRRRPPLVPGAPRASLVPGQAKRVETFAQYLEKGSGDVDAAASDSDDGTEDRPARRRKAPPPPPQPPVALRPFDGTDHIYGTYCVAWSEKSGYVASGCKDGSVAIWLDGISVVVIPKAHSVWVRCLAWSSCGKVLATGSMDGSVAFWKLDGSKVRPRLEFEKADALLSKYGRNSRMPNFYVLALALLKPETFGTEAIALAGGGGTVAVWSILGAPALLRKMTAHTDCVRALRASPDGLALASGCDDKTVRVWDLVGDEHSVAVHGFHAHVHAVAWSPDSLLLAAAASDSTVRVVHARRAVTAGVNKFGTNLWTWRGDSAGVTSGCTDVAFSPSGAVIAVATAKAVFLFVAHHAKRRLGSSLRKFEVKDLRFNFAFSPDSLRLACCVTINHAGAAGKGGDGAGSPPAVARATKAAKTGAAKAAQPAPPVPLAWLDLPRAYLLDIED
ncbi:WD40-repeat-containing domain protein [Pelagophyceae sp. CCMP2097]|nr:WD40-repeat-containing domain protein [Pelagophyceae sp. CCMP2097]